MIFANGLIYSDTPAEAVAVANGKIIFVGSDAEVEAYSGADTKWVDLDGALLLPGFVDFHNHFAEGGVTACFPEKELTLEAQKDLLADCAYEAFPDQWVVGYGGSLATVLGESGDLITQTPVEVLDELFPDNPVIIMEHTSHAMFVNSQALEEAGITAETPDPPGGVIMKDEAGALNGVLVDNAGDIVMEIAENSYPDLFDINYEGVEYGLMHVREAGITTVGDGRTYWQRGMMEVWQAVEADGGLTARISVRPWIYPELSQEEQMPFLESFYQNDISRSLIVNQVKMYIDGVPENGTARVISPYTNTILGGYPNGLNYITEAEMIDWLIDLQEIGYGAHVHSLGDLGVRETLNAFEAARNQGSDLPYSITHAFMIDPADLPRFAELNVDADIQVGEKPLPTHSEQAGNLASKIGQERVSQILLGPVAALYASGANVILSSDWTVYDINPLVGISVSVAQGSFETVEEAIDSYTIRPAEALGLDSITGSIEVGKSADFAILAEDITQLPAEQIRDTSLTMTVFQGEIVYP